MHTYTIFYLIDSDEGEPQELTLSDPVGPGEVVYLPERECYHYVSYIQSGRCRTYLNLSKSATSKEEAVLFAELLKH